MGSSHLLPLTIYGVLFFATLVTGIAGPDMLENAAVPIKADQVTSLAKTINPGSVDGVGCPDSFDIKVNADLVEGSLKSEETAFILVDFQKDFCQDQGGAIPVTGTKELAMKIRDEVLSLEFGVVIATKAWHPKDHYSFLSSIQNALEKFNPNNVIIPTEDKKAYTITLQNQNTLNTWTLNNHYLWKDHCVEGLPGSDFHPDLVGKLESLRATVVHKGVYKTRENLGAFVTSYEHEYLYRSQKKPNNINLYNFLKEKKIKNVVIGGLAFEYSVTETACQASKGDEKDHHAPKPTGFRVFVLTDGSGCLTKFDSDERNRACQALKDKEVQTLTIDQLKKHLSNKVPL